MTESWSIDMSPDLITGFEGRRYLILYYKKVMINR